MPIVTGVSALEGYWQETDKVLSCVFPPGTEPDPGLVRDVRVVMPHFVPIHMRLVYATPAQSVEYLDFVIAGRWAPYADDWKDPLKVERPYDFPFKGGVIYDQRTFGTVAFGMEEQVPKVWQDRGINDIPLVFDREMADWVIFAHKWFMCGDPVKQKAMTAEAARRAKGLKVLKDVRETAKGKLGEHLASPYGVNKDAAWEMAYRPKVSVQLGA